MKKYISAGSWFSFEYPDKWSEFEDEEGSFLFYDPDCWRGNFRISASMDKSTSFARDTMRDELNEYADAKLVNIGEMEFVYSKESFQEDKAWYTSHYWVTGHKNMVIYCTFTTNKCESVDEAIRMLRTLRLYNPMQPQCHEVIPIRLSEIVTINTAYETIQKEVKNALKKDFSSVDTTTSITHLQKMIDEGKLKINPQNAERLAYVLGCFLIDETDGMEWVSVINGKEEYPALYFKGDDAHLLESIPLKEAQNRVIEPVKMLVDGLRKGYKLSQLYNTLMNNNYSF